MPLNVGTTSRLNHAVNLPPSVFFLTPMRPPDPEQPHRTATVLELFLDLVFVVDVSTVGVQLHHALTEGHAGKGIGLYFMVFSPFGGHG